MTELPIGSVAKIEQTCFVNLRYAGSMLARRSLT